MINAINNFDLRLLLSLNHFFAKWPLFINKFFAEYLIYTIPLILLAVWFYEKKGKKIALAAFFSAMLAWPIIANIIGHWTNRARPFNAGGVQELFFHRPTYSFPSDHAAALFAIAFSFWLSGYKKLAVFMFIVAILISFFRVSSGIHWPTDILGGAVAGIVSAWIIFVLEKPLEFIYNFIINLARKVRLA